MRPQKFQNRNRSIQHKIMTLLNWIPMGVMLLQQMALSDAVKFKGDSCISKGTGGICREWSECPIIKTLIERGEYTNREVVSCGFGIREELICCPNIKSVGEEDTTTVQNTDRVKTTTEGSERDFWADLITSSTTVSPDFWLALVPSTTPSTTTSTTTTTTIKPLILGDQRLNESSEFFDLNALLNGNQNGGRKKSEELNLGTIRPNNNPPNQGFVNQNSNGRGNLNTGPVNFNQWNFNNSPAGPQANNGRGNSNGFRGNGNGNFGRGQQNIGRGQLNQPQNFGRGQQNNGRGQQNNGRGNQNNGNNGRGRNSNGNQNRGFIFPENNNRPNVLENEQVPNTRPVGPGPVNVMEDQKPNTGEQSKLQNLIQDVFDTTENNNNNNQAIATPVAPSTDNTEEKHLDNLIANLFNVNNQQAPTTNTPTPTPSNQPTVWLNPQENPNNKVEFFPKPQQQHQQMEFPNPQPPGHFQVVPTIQNPIINNNLDAAPSTSFIQQPVVVETWPSNSAPQTEFNPIQVVYENLVNSGMDIVKAQQVPNVFNQPQQQQQFVAHPQFGQVVVPQTASQPFVQQPQFFHQPPLAPQNFGQHTSEQLVQQSEASSKEPRSTSPIQQLVQEPSRVSAFNVQSPPSNILDPFKPFEFRPPPEDENANFEDNNSLSSNPTPKPDTSKDRPAVRACRRIESGLTPYLTDHILGGTPAEKGEFPHMVALGYSRIGGDDKPPYDIRCGGTLIDKRFVLTAAHCVAERDNVPVIVRLGVVNFSDPAEMSTAVELRIKETYIHDDYSTRLTYNDIAILELEREVETNENIYPVCLYTNEKDPDSNIRLWVTGWGTYNTTTRSFSNILLKAPLHTSPLENCNKSFTEYGLNRRIPEGIIRTQFCAEDKDQIRDACQGDSGGPLNLIVDESYKNYRLVGIVSSGFGCASSTPGLYTRVAAFLDFIEKIVWPNGGD